MKVVLFGGTGMVGQGVLRECLEDADINSVLVIGRQSTGVQHAKLREVLHANFLDFSTIADEFRGLDACFFCLGVSSFRMTEADYRRTTYDMTLVAARALVTASPAMIFEYISGEGTDSSASGRTMWARVKGETENALFKMQFKAAYMFRPGLIIPLDGIRSKTAIYRLAYAILRPLLPVIKKIAPTRVTDTRQLGLAMIWVAKNGAAKRIFDTKDIGQLCQGIAAPVVWR